MNIQVQIQVCRACLKPPESVKLTELNSESVELQNFHSLLQIEVLSCFLLQNLFFYNCVYLLAILCITKNILRQVYSEN